MPQHSFGTSSRACATISSTSCWEIFMAARLTKPGRGDRAPVGGPGRLRRAVDVEQPGSLAERAVGIRRQLVAPGEPVGAGDALAVPHREQPRESGFEEFGLAARSLD